MASLPLTRRKAISWPALPALGLLALLALALWLGLDTLTSVPAVVPSVAPADQFSAERAMRDLQVVAAAPHPVGSPRNAEVRDYLLTRLRAMGLAPEVQATTIFNHQAPDGIVNVAEVENILVRVPGTQSTGAVLLTGHYDSVPTSPGGSDCGACVVTVLETLRALRAGPPLQNDLIVLFTDAEEIGVMGARAFMEQHPRAPDVRVSMVFEAMGTGGASLLYATSPQNGALVPLALDAIPHPAASSLIHDLMWNISGNSGSDLDALIDESHAGMAFVYLQGSSTYHTMADRPDQIDPRSIQHHGSSALALARAFGNTNLAAITRQPDAVFFPVLPGLVARYPGSWAMPLAIIAALGWGALVATGVRRKRLAIRGLALGALAYLMSLLTAVVLVTTLWWLLRRLNPNLHIVLFGAPYNAELYLLAFLALTLAIVLMTWSWLGRAATPRDLLVGGLACWVGLALLTARGMTGLSYLFTWPLLTALAGSFWLLRLPDEGAAWQRMAALALIAMPAFLLAAPAIDLLSVLAGRLEAISGLPLAALPLPLAVCVAALLIPALPFVAPRRQTLIGGGAVVLAIALLLAATARSGFSPAQPATSTVAYLLDADAGTARWLTLNDSRSGRGTGAQLDDWTRQFFPDGGEPTTFNPWLAGWMPGEFPALQAAAPVVALPASDVTTGSNTVRDGQREVQVRVTQPVEVQDSFIRLESSAPIATLTIHGELVALPPGQTSVRVNIFGRPDAGTTLAFATGANATITVTVQDRLPQLPSVPGLTIAPRPDWSMPAPFTQLSGSSIVQHRNIWTP